MEKKKILLVEDDQTFRTLIKDCLEWTGKYEVAEAEDALGGFSAYKSFNPDVVIADIELSSRSSGLDLVKQIRKEDSFIPILIITGSDKQEDINTGFDYKIDNYIKKPFQPEVLIHFIEAVLRRVDVSKYKKEGKNQLLSIGSFLFDLKNHCLTREGETKHLTPFEMLILQLLCENKNDTVNRKDILKQIWNDEDDLYSRCLDRFITELRNKLKVDKSVQIVNTRGVGFKLTC